MEDKIEGKHRIGKISDWIFCSLLGVGIVLSSVTIIRWWDYQTWNVLPLDGKWDVCCAVGVCILPLIEWMVVVAYEKRNSKGIKNYDK
jgi:hypothetical protein